MSEKSLKKTLHLVNNPDSIEKWSLNEGLDGKIEEHGYIPWDLSLSFLAKNLHYGFVSERELDAEVDEDEEDFYNIVTEVIRAELEFNERSSLFLPFTFFGTDRDIKDFSLAIYKRQEIDKDLDEACYLWGVPEYEYEIDFRQEHQDDCLGIDLYMEGKKFDELKSLLVSKSLASLSISIKRVKGIYAPWTPSITPDALKVLTTDIKIQTDDEKFKEELGDVLAPISKVSKWSVAWHTKQDLIFSESDDEEEDWFDAIGKDDEEEKVETKEEYLINKTNRQLQQITKMLPQAKKFAYAVLILLALIAFALL